MLVELIINAIYNNSSITKYYIKPQLSEKLGHTKQTRLMEKFDDSLIQSAGGILKMNSLKTKDKSTLEVL